MHISIEAKPNMELGTERSLSTEHFKMEGEKQWISPEFGMCRPLV